MTQRRIPESTGGSSDPFISKPAGSGYVYINNTPYGGDRRGVYPFGTDAEFRTDSTAFQSTVYNVTNPTLSGEISTGDGFANTQVLSFTLGSPTTTAAGTVNVQASFPNVGGDVILYNSPNNHTYTGATIPVYISTNNSTSQPIMLRGTKIYMHSAGYQLGGKQAVIPSYNPTLGFNMSLTGFDASFSKVVFNANLTAYELGSKIID